MTGDNRRIRTNSKRDKFGSLSREEEGENDSLDHTTKPILEDKSTPPLETPRVLTSGSVNSLTHGLDASDVVECYALVRSAPLHGIANSTITIQKMTIGIRFRPKPNDLKNPFNVKTPMELTLEYGPARLGPTLSDEATPIVQGSDESSAYLTWDNAAKVYYTQKINTERFLHSHYMASMTGAVLNKLLREAVAYTEKRKVYQPFAIYSDNNKMLLRSSSSSDFAAFVWLHLARLGVDIEPILTPAMYETRLYTKSVEKVFPDQAVTRAAATFYRRLYSCLESIATNNYGFFQSSKERSTVDDDNDIISSDEDGNNRDLAFDLAGSKEQVPIYVNTIDIYNRRVLEGETNEKEAAKDIDEMISNVEETQDTELPEDVAEKEIIVQDSRPHDELTLSGDHDAESDDIPRTDLTISPEVTSSPNFSPTDSKVTLMPSETSTDEHTDQEVLTALETLTPTEEIQDVEKAQNAASDAQKAADEAKIAAQTEGETKAADAAQAAADAALAAADATSNAASQAAMDSLLSGDGAMMSSIVSTCFSNPKYEILSPDANRTDPTEIYLFRDPSTYYKLELTSPYLEVVKLNRPLPSAATLNSVVGSGGDALDWTLAISIFLSIFLMILLICQQMGKHYVACVLRCQRRFFNPRNHGDDEEPISGVQSGSHFFFGKNGIPVSMGGKQTSYSPLRSKESIQNVIVDESYTDDSGGEMEHDLRPLTPKLSQGSHRRLASRELEMVNFNPDSQFNNKGSSALVRPYRDSSESTGSSEDDEMPHEIPDRLLRNPDLVELPSLKSKSRVAMPVGSSPNGTVSYASP